MLSKRLSILASQQDYLSDTLLYSPRAGKGMEDETQDPRFAYEARDEHRIKSTSRARRARYVGVTKKTRKSGKVVFEARACVTKHKGNGRRQYAVGTFGSAVAAAIAIAQAEADPLGPRSPEAERQTRTCALPAARHFR